MRPVGNDQKAAITIKPARGMLGELMLKLDDHQLRLWRQDFEIQGARNLEMRVTAVQGGEVTRLQQIRIVTPDSLIHASAGSAYLAIEYEGDREKRIVSAALTTEGSQKSLPIDFTIDDRLTLSNSATLAVSIDAPRGEEVFLYGAHWRLPDESEQHETVEDILSRKSPFDAQQVEKIIDAAKAVPDSLTIIATLIAE